jgi:diaminopimelate epimerase
MTVRFEKYQGTGNDFIMIDNRDLFFPKENTELIEKLCHRRFGIGADGLILLENHHLSHVDFRMVYFNSDGRESTMCGNGGRCIVAFAHSLGLFEDKTVFEAIDGMHEAFIEEDSIHLKMQDVNGVTELEQGKFLLNTGSPHYVSVAAVFPENFVDQARAVRYSEPFKREGVNVNFIVPQNAATLRIRTYERGVEDETYSCGTGAVAAAICHAENYNSSRVTVLTSGGELQVRFEKNNANYSDVWLIGPAVKVFDGQLRLW